MTALRITLQVARLKVRWYQSPRCVPGQQSAMPSLIDASL